MTNIENSGKHHAKAQGFPGVLTYNALTSNPAVNLGVAVPFSENTPAQVCGSRPPLENKNGPRPDGNPSEGLTLTHGSAQMAGSAFSPYSVVSLAGAV